MKSLNSYIIKYLKFDKVLSCVKELDSLSKAKSKEQRNSLLREAENCVIDAISEIAKNCLAGNIPLRKCDFIKLKKYKNILREISKKSSNISRRKIIKQNGGILQLLIPPALSLIASVVGDIVSKKLRR